MKISILFFIILFASFGNYAIAKPGFEFNLIIPPNREVYPEYRFSGPRYDFRYSPYYRPYYHGWPPYYQPYQPYNGYNYSRRDRYRPNPYYQYHQRHK